MSATPSPDPACHSPISDEDLRTCLAVLEAARHLDSDDPAHARIVRAVSHLEQAAKKQRRQARRARARQADRALLGRVAGPGGSADALHAIETGGARSGGSLHNERSCYVCRRSHREVHHFYAQLCPGCGEENLAHREARAQLGGRRALVTGGRIKIGFQTALKLLRDGAAVVVTTRFPRDAARRYAAQPNFSTWRDRLTIVGIDLRQLPSVLGFTDELLARGEPLDILINNAAQTIRRPANVFEHLVRGEDDPLAPELEVLVRPACSAARPPAPLLEVADPALFPAGALDQDGAPLDLSPRNSWTLELQDVSPIELVEVQVVNAIVPFLLAGRLRPLMERSARQDRYVINVSAMEGQFARPTKTPFHPHTNMAKAALNMLTRTSAQAYAAAGIYMCSVDTGWITDENPYPKRTRTHAQGFRTPLDVIDGAARVYHPIVRGVSGDPVFGCFLKDYRPTEW